MDDRNSSFAKTFRRSRVRSIRECAPPRTRGISCSESIAKLRGRITPAAQLAKHDRSVRLLAHQLRQDRDQLAAPTGVDPVRPIPVEMVATGPCRDPDLTRRRVAIDDYAAAVGEFDLQYADGSRIV